MHRMVSGAYIKTLFVPPWYRVSRLAQDMAPHMMPAPESPTDGPYYKLFWEDVQLGDEKTFEHYVEAHGMPLNTPVDIYVYVGERPRDV